MSIVVIGSSNTDMVVKVGSIPQEGETILGQEFTTHRGGKGANQAVAAARLGADVTYIANIGNDDFGDKALLAYQEEGICTDYIYRDGNASGVALIMVSQVSGNNCIAVSPESNALLKPFHIEQNKQLLTEAKVVLIQLETPLDTVQAVSDILKETETTFILNPAPAQDLSKDILRNIDIITPNETEAEILTGVRVFDETSAREAGIAFCNAGVKIAIITLGEKGAYIHSKDCSKLVAATKVKAVDTTAAGDTFNGALAYALVAGDNIEESVKFACVASGLSVTKHGAQESAPTLSEVNSFI